MDFKEIKQKINKLPEKDKKLYFLYIPIGAVVLIAALALKSSLNNNNKTVTVEESEDAVPLPGVETEGKGYQSKTAAYRALMEKKDNVDFKKRRMKEDDFFGFTPEEKKAAEEKKVSVRDNDIDLLAEVANEKAYEAATENESKNVSRSQQNRTSAYRKTAAPKPQIEYVYRDRKPASRPQKQEKTAVQPEKEETYYGIGVYQASQNSSTQESSGGEFLSAVLEENKKLRDGSQLTFIATSDIKTETGNIPKQSLLFGYVDFMNERIEVHINRVRDTKGKNFPCNLVGYNENFQRGIKYEGKVDKAMERSSNTVVDEVAATSGSATGRLAGRMISNTKDAFKRPPEIFIGKGYRMHFKEKKN